MKKIFLILVILFIGIGISFGQDGKGKKRERIEAMKVAFITEKLALTPSEAETFWPITNQYSAKRKALHQNYKSEKKVKDMTDSEAEDFLNSHIAKEQQMLDLKKDYIQQLKTVLPIKKIIKLQRANRQFKKELVKRAKKGKMKQKAKNKKEKFNK